MFPSFYENVPYPVTVDLFWVYHLRSYSTNTIIAFNSSFNKLSPDQSTLNNLKFSKTHFDPAELFSTSFGYNTQFISEGTQIIWLTAFPIDK